MDVVVSASDFVRCAAVIVRAVNVYTVRGAAAEVGRAAAVNVVYAKKESPPPYECSERETEAKHPTPQPRNDFPAGVMDIAPIVLDMAFVFVPGSGSDIVLVLVPGFAADIDIVLVKVVANSAAGGAAKLVVLVADTNPSAMVVSAPTESDVPSPQETAGEEMSPLDMVVPFLLFSFLYASSSLYLLSSLSLRSSSSSPSVECFGGIPRNSSSSCLLSLSFNPNPNSIPTSFVS